MRVEANNEMPRVFVSDKSGGHSVAVEGQSARAEEDFANRRHAWWSAAALMILYALSYLDRQIIALVVDPVRQTFSIGDFQISMLQGLAFAVLYTICALPFGAAVDRFSRRWIIFAGVIMWSIATIACGIANSFEALLIARMAVGIGEAALLPAAYSLLADLFPRAHLTAALSLFVAGALLGTELSLALGGLILHIFKAPVLLPIVGETAPWRLAFLLSGLPGLVLAFLAFTIREPARRAGEKDVSGWTAALMFVANHKRFFFCHFIGFSLLMALSTARASWNPAFLVRSFGWTITQASYALALFGLAAGILAFTTSGRIVDKWFARGVRDAHFRFYAIVGLALGPVGAFAYLASEPMLYFAAMLFATLPLSMGAISAAAIQIVTTAPLRGKVSALYLLVVGLVGMTFGPAIVGLLSDQWFTGAKGLGQALALTFAILAPISGLLFFWGLAAMRKAVTARDVEPNFKE